MDLPQRGMDGWEATERLRRDQRTAAIPVVALTAHALAHEQPRAIAAGCTRVVTKPCMPDALVTEVSRVLASAKSGTTR